MSVYVDNMNLTWKNKKWCHLMADTEEELHHFALRLGLQRLWYQNDHYDITTSKKKLAIELGAIEVDPIFLVGLRKKWKNV